MRPLRQGIHLPTLRRSSQTTHTSVRFASTVACFANFIVILCSDIEDFEDEPYECELCYKKFGYKASVKKHMQVTYSCSTRQHSLAGVPQRRDGDVRLRNVRLCYALRRLLTQSHALRSSGSGTCVVFVSSVANSSSRHRVRKLAESQVDAYAVLGKLEATVHPEITLD